MLFDLDDTLFRHRDAVAHGVLQHRWAQGGALAAADDVTAFARWQRLEEHHYHRYLSGELDFLEQRRERARDFVAGYGIDLDSDQAADAWFAAYLAHYRSAWALHDDVLPMLDALRAQSPGVRIGVITNAALSFQLEKIEAIGLAPHLEHVVASGEVGAAKPDPRIFEHAASVFGVPLRACLYVGDRLETDAIGAWLAGMRGIWLCRDREPTPEEARLVSQARVDVIRSLAELPALLA